MTTGGSVTTTREAREQFEAENRKNAPKVLKYTIEVAIPATDDFALSELSNAMDELRGFAEANIVDVKLF